MRIARQKLVTTTRIRVALVLWFVALNVQTLTLAGWSWDVTSDLSGEQAIKVYHIVGIVLFIALMGTRFRVPQPPILISVLFADFIVGSLVTFTWNGFNPLLANYVFALLAFIIGMQFAVRLEQSAIIRCLRVSAVIIIVAISIKTFLFRTALVDFYLMPVNGHPAMPLYFYGGGPNLEASWIALLASLFLGSCWFVPVIAAAVLVSALYASRTGMLICIGCIAIALIRAGRYKLLISAVVIIGAAVGAVLLAFPELYVFSRFTSIGSDPGSIGRLNIWAGIWNAFLESPLVGHGAGNGIAAVERVLNTKFFEANVHNYYAQLLLDFGVVAGLLYGVMVFTIGKNEVRSSFKHPLGAYLILFFIASCLQFRGAEALAWFVLGLYATENRVAPSWLSHFRRHPGPAPTYA